MKIAIDIDDVLADSLPEFLEAFNRRFGLQVSVTEAGWEIFRRHPEISSEQRQAFFDVLAHCLDHLFEGRVFGLIFYCS